MIRQLLLQLILIGVNAVFASAEIALISVNETRVEHLASRGDKRARKLLSLTGQPARFLATIQVGITLAGFLGSAFAADNFAERMVVWFGALGIPAPAATLRAVSVVIITLILSYVTLVLGELVPKRIAMKQAEPLALFLASFLVFIAQIFSPLVWLLTRSSNILLRILGINPETEEPTVTEEEIRMMVDAGSRKGTIDAEERAIIHRVFEFDNTSAEEVMTHRTQVAILWLRDGDEVWEQRIRENRHRYYPVCGDSPDDIAGVLDSQDYLRLEDRTRKTVLEKAVRGAYGVPESVKIDALFRRMQQSRNHFALVVDEYGGLSGVLTMNDLLEQLVGSLEDNAAEPLERPRIEELEPGLWRVQGSTPLDKVEEALGVTLPAQKYDTLGGFVFSLLGEIPQDGEKARLQEYGLIINIEEIKERRLETALVRRETLPEKG